MTTWDCVQLGIVFISIGITEYVVYCANKRYKYECLMEKMKEQCDKILGDKGKDLIFEPQIEDWIVKSQYWTLVEKKYKPIINTPEV